MKYAYFPGCALHSTAEDYDRSANAVSLSLNLELLEIPDWICCGATPAHITNHILAVALPIANCVWAEKQGLDVVTSCAACFHRLKLANMEVREDRQLLAKVNEVLEEDYKGNVKTFHLLEVIVHNIGVDKIKGMVKRDLSGLKVASYYGCLMTRLPQELRMDSSENPTLMDELIAGIGAQTTDWAYKTECCGATLSIVQKKSARRLVYDILRIAKDGGANCIVVACPLCQSNLDLLQTEVERKYRAQFNIPIFYFTQLVGLAIGEEAEGLGLRKLIVDPYPLLRNKGIIKED